MDKLDANNFGVEIKSPKPRQHLRNIDTNCKEYRGQAQGCMAVTGADFWYIVSFCPDVKAAPLHIVRIQRNPTMIADILESAVNGANEVDALVERIEGAVVQRPEVAEKIKAISAHALEAWENVFFEGDVNDIV